MSEEKIQIIVAAQDQASRQLAGMSANVKKFGADVKSGIAMGFGIGTVGLISNAAGAVTDFVGDSIEAASHLEQSQMKVQQVFGDSAGAVEDWAENSVESMAMSKQAALEAAGTYGNLLRGFGVVQPKAVEMSETLVELAADLASFNDTTNEEALVALRSGLTGEMEPLKRYGIALDDAQMRTWLLANTTEKLGATLTPLQKSQASYALILEKSALAQGDLSRSMETNAVKAKQLAAEQENMAAEMGENLLPIQMQLNQSMLEGTRIVSGLFDVLKTGPGEDTNEQLTDFKDTLVSINDVIPDFLGLRQDMIDGIDQIADRASLGGDKIIEEFKRTGAQIPPALSAGITSARADMLAQALPWARLLGLGTQEVKRIADDSAQALTGNLADALRGSKDVVSQAMDDVMWAIEHPMKLQAELARIEGALTTLEYKRGLASNTDAVNTVIDQQMQVLRDAWMNLTGRAYDWGANAGAAWTDGYKHTISKVPGVSGAFTGGGGKRVRGGRAAGGPTEAFEAYTVGERGPETLVMGGRSGYVISHGGQGGRGDDHTHPIVINLDGREIYRNFDRRQGQQLAMASGSAYTRA